MSKTIKITKGLSIKLQGVAERIINQLPLPKEVAIKPTDFTGLVPKLAVKENDTVLAGEPLFFDKNNPQIQFTSPVSGSVKLINRGDRRKLLEVIVQTDEAIKYKEFAVSNFESMPKNKIVDLLLESGIWPSIKQRPFNCIANPGDMPKAIHISAFDTAPLAPDYPFMIDEYKKVFQQGIAVLQKLTEGKVHLNIFHESRTINPFESCTTVQKNYFSGPHPAGNVGIQIHHIDPINKGDIVWTINPQDVIIIGRLFEKGIYDARKTIALTGSIKKPHYVKTIVGASINSLCNEENIDENMRVISGNVLTGTNVGRKGFLGYFDAQISIIPEGNKPEFMGWILPGFNKFSMHRSFFSWLKPEKKYILNTNLNGGERAFVFTGVYEKVLPMDIYPMHLLKAIITNNIDQMEQLGIYEVVEEDFALCEFICPSKIEIQSIIREGLDTIKKEFS